MITWRLYLYFTVCEC